MLVQPTGRRISRVPSNLFSSYLSHTLEQFKRRHSYHLFPDIFRAALVHSYPLIIRRFPRFHLNLILLVLEPNTCAREQNALLFLFPIKSRITMAMAMTSAIAVAVVFVLGTVAASDEGFVGVGCEESSTCPCPKNLDPVCDGQGKEYGNQCIFDCVKERCPGKVAGSQDQVTRSLWFDWLVLVCSRLQEHCEDRLC